jgi:alpha-mannosidase
MLSKSKKSTKKNTVYLVPHTHYDAVWVFTKEDYFYINIELILKKAIEMMEKSDFHFLIEQTFLLEEIEKRNPYLFERIKKLIEQGKIEIADGEYLMADTMVPQGETLVREILFGKRYIKEKFNKSVPVMWGADSFGYNNQFPQILKKTGYKYFAFRRGTPINKPSEFWWKGLDGTKILTHWMPKGYRAGLDMSKWEENLKILKEASVGSNILMPCGSGVTAPQSETMKEVAKWNRAHPNLEIKVANVSDFFEGLEKEMKSTSKKTLKTIKGEMYSGKYSEVFPSVCSTRIWIKQNLRKYENLLLTCEQWTTIAWIMGIKYPAHELRENWKKILFAAFHDSTPGTGIDSVYDELRSYFSLLKNHLGSLFQNSLQTIAQDIKIKGDFVVFNSLSWRVKNWTEVFLRFEQGKVKDILGLRSGKQEIEIEILEFTRYADDSYETVKIGFIADVPSSGYRAYHILGRKPKTGVKGKIKIVGNTIENEFFDVKINPSSGIIDVFKNNRLLAHANEIILDEEIGDLYYHRQNLSVPLKTETGNGVKYGGFNIKSFQIRKTNLRRIINIEVEYFSLRWPYRLLNKRSPLMWRHKFISIHKKIIIYNELPRIDFITTIRNKHPRVRIRTKFSTPFNSPKYHCESQFGVVERPVNESKKPSEGYVEKPCGVFPSINWVDYSSKKEGVTLINKGLPENEVTDGNIYLTLLRSIEMVSSDGGAGPTIPTPDAREFKTYDFHYALFPHSKTWKESECFKSAYEFNYNMTGLQLKSGQKEKNKKIKNEKYEQSFLEIKPVNLVFTALKKSEDDDEAILRFFETKGEKTSGEIIFFKDVKSAKIVNLLEQESGEKRDIKVNHKKISFSVNPFEIITLKVKFN